MSRLLSGASMESHSILLEHTLVLSGENVNAGTVWQGWPSRQQVDLKDYRRTIHRILNRISYQYYGSSAVNRSSSSSALASSSSKSDFHSEIDEEEGSGVDGSKNGKKGEKKGKGEGRPRASSGGGNSNSGENERDPLIPKSSAAVNSGKKEKKNYGGVNN
jgi:hypothetical protein